MDGKLTTQELGIQNYQSACIFRPSSVVNETELVPLVRPWPAYPNRKQGGLTSPIAIAGHRGATQAPQLKTRPV